MTKLASAAVFSRSSSSSGKRPVIGSSNILQHGCCFSGDELSEALYKLQREQGSQESLNGSCEEAEYKAQHSAAKKVIKR